MEEMTIICWMIQVLSGAVLVAEIHLAERGEQEGSKRMVAFTNAMEIF